ncbi:MAG: inositol monophosphatase family protein [Acidothermaceae bacterium]
MTISIEGFSRETQLAIVAATRAAELLRAGAGRDRVTSKGIRDVVTETDVTVEAEIRAVAERAGISIVGEEGGGIAPERETYWLVDPLCGTSNYVAGLPLYCANIAVVRSDEVVAGVVADASGLFLVAERGLGTLALHGGSLRPARTASTPAVIVEPGRATGERRVLAAAFTSSVIRSDRWDVMALNSTLSLAYVADGRASAYVLFASAALHVAAGAALAVEAGGVVTDLDGVPWSLRSDALVTAANPQIHAELMSFLSTSAER